MKKNTWQNGRATFKNILLAIKLSKLDANYIQQF